MLEQWRVHGAGHAWSGGSAAGLRPAMRAAAPGNVRFIDESWPYAQVKALIAGADVLVTNPTHYAVAIAYKRDTMSAPKIVAKGIREIRVDRPTMGVVLITHYQRLLDELQPDHVHIMVQGRIVASGGMELAAQLEADGYEAFR